MPDVFTPEKRSEVMSRIRSRGNKDTELRLMTLMKEAGIKGWRRHIALKEKVRRAGEKAGGVRVRPDFVFRKEHVAVFVDGCFWHGCPKCYVRPKQNRKFWDAKIVVNQSRDKKVTRVLRRDGWKVLRLWECALTPKRAKATVGRLRRALESL